MPTAAPFIGFAIGPFEMIKFTPSQLQEEMLTGANLDENQRQSLLAEINMMSNIYAFALPGREEELNISCNFLMHVSHLLFLCTVVDTHKFSGKRPCIITHRNTALIPFQITNLFSWKMLGAKQALVHRLPYAGQLKKNCRVSKQ